MKPLQIARAAGWWAYARMVNLRRIKTRNSGPWIMGRIGCMGLDVLKLIQLEQPLVNTQKGRVDCLLAYSTQPTLRPHTAALPHHYARDDIIHLVAQQEVFRWPKNTPPMLVLMDSYAELTDQLFIHRQKRWMFCSNYQDLHQSPAFARDYECRGLIPIDDLKRIYTQFFGELTRDLPQVPVLFLHFPTDLDSREKFKIRHDAIKVSIREMSRIYPNLHSIETDPDIVKWPENAPEATKDFPYHYNQATYLNLADKIRRLKLNI